jgi:hypothetical protein
MNLTGENRSTGGKTCPSATLSTTNPTWTDRGSNPCLRGERPATNRLSHGTAIIASYYSEYLSSHIRISCIHKLHDFITTAKYFISGGGGGGSCG